MKIAIMLPGTAYTKGFFQSWSKLIAADKDIISAVYPMGVNNPDVAVAGWIPDMRLTLSACKIAIDGEIGPLEVDFCGLGFILVKRGVFESLYYPWFWEMYSNEGIKVKYLGDDFSFCNHVREKGFKVYVHTGVIAGHEKSVVVRGL